MAVKSRDPSGSAFPELKTANLPEQRPTHSFQKQPIFSELGALVRAVVRRRAECFGIENSSVRFDFALGAIQKARPDVFGGFQQRRRAQVFEDQAEMLASIKVNLQILNRAGRGIIRSAPP